MEEYEWQLLHSEDEKKGQEEESKVTVTKLIQFLGYGYESRNQLFNSNKNKKKDNRYLELCKSHGSKYQDKCLVAIRELYQAPRYEVISHPYLICESKNIIGTPDAYILDKEKGEYMIVEIKCPYGNAYGTFDVDYMRFDFENEEKKWKHWIQLQIYLYLHKDFYLFKQGLLIYYYPFASSDGKQVISINEVNFCTELEQGLCIEENAKLYLDYINGRKSFNPRSRHRKSKFISTDLIFTTGIRRIVHILE